jgi:Integrase core domain
MGRLCEIGCAIWPNLLDTLGEARQAIEAYVTYYNEQRIHLALDYQTPSEVAASLITRAAGVETRSEGRLRGLS